jgi:selenocysteine lyase/cysteine desulfurase
MTSDRRRFVQGLGLGALSALAGCASPSAAPKAAAVPGSVALPVLDPARPEIFWRGVRACYPLLTDPVYLNTGGLGPAPQSVLDRAVRTTNELQAHSETGHDRLAGARAVTAEFLGAERDELCFVRNATEATSIVAAGLPLRAGDEVIFESHAHPGGSFPWLNQARLRGVVVRIFEPANESPEENVRRILALITPRTRVIQVSHITCTNGLVLPVAEIAAMTRARGIWFHVDGAQAIGMIPLNLAAMGCDSYAASGHKWLGAPHETGLLYIRRNRWNDVAPTGIGSYSAEVNWLPGDIEYAPGAWRHEYGTRNAATIEAVAEAMRFQRAIGTDRIAARGHEMASFLHEELSRLPGVVVLTPRDPSMRGSMTTFQHPRADASRTFRYLLDRRGLRCRPVTEQGLQGVRVSTHLSNLPDECERVVAGVRDSLRDL